MFLRFFRSGFITQYIAIGIIGWQVNKDKSESYYGPSGRFSTIQAGMGIPLFNRAQRARIKAAQQQQAIAGLSTEMASRELQARLDHSWNQYLKCRQAMAYYKENAIPQSSLLFQTANLSYRNGAIGYIEWATLVTNAVQLQSQYLDSLKDYNIQKIELEYILQTN